MDRLGASRSEIADVCHMSTSLRWMRGSSPRMTETIGTRADRTGCLKIELEFDAAACRRPPQARAGPVPGFP